MTTDDFSLKSTNFNVDKDGNMSCTNANINGTITSSNATITGGSILITGNLSRQAFVIEEPNNPKNKLIIGYDGINIINEDDINNQIALIGRNGNYSIACGQISIFEDKIIAPEYSIEGKGVVVYSRNSHICSMAWANDTKLEFWVDDTNVGTLSDKRLKTDIKEIDDKFIQAIEEIEMKQFKVANRNGLISFGILAQDLIEIFKKYDISPFDYEIVYETQYRTDDNTIYYAINYEQFLILKAKAQELKIKELQEKDKQKDEIIQNLIKRVENLEKGVINE